MPKENKKTIYVSGALLDIHKECQGNPNRKSFSKRLAQIADRYETLIGMQPVPELTKYERGILTNVLEAERKNLSKIKNLATAEEINREKVFFIKDLENKVSELVFPNTEIAHKIAPLNELQRMALIEEVEKYVD